MFKTDIFLLPDMMCFLLLSFSIARLLRECFPGLPQAGGEEGHVGPD